MSATRSIYIRRYEQITGKKYDGSFFDHGLLEIGSVLGPQVTANILQGFLPPLHTDNLIDDYWNTIELMERAQIPNMPAPTVDELTESGTYAVALSYRHTVLASNLFPRRRMNELQKKDLMLALQSLAIRQNASRIFVWVDQAMGQRNPLDERDWIRHGILPYFAFDVLILQEQHDPRRCWLFLESLISESYSRQIAVGEKANLFTKTHEIGTISPIQEVASQVLGGILLNKLTYNEDDKEQIRCWAARLLEQKVSSRERFESLVGGSSWKPRLRDANGLAAMITNHTVSTGHVAWLSLSPHNTTHRWNGMSELLGLPDKDITKDHIFQIRICMSNREERYIFNTIAARSSIENRVRGVGIGRFGCSGRPPRIIICALDGIRNTSDTCVLASCILDCDVIRDASCGTASFESAFEAIVQMRRKEADNKIMNMTDGGELVRDTQETIAKKRRSVLDRLAEWTWFSSALAQKDIQMLDSYMESTQAGSIKWS